MFIPLQHKSLVIYQVVRALVKEVYKVSKTLPPEEKFNMLPQLRRAALSVKLNLAEGSTRRSEVERKRYLEVSRGSIVEIDAAFETALDLDYYSENDLKGVCELTNKCFAMLSNMITKMSHV